jgi:DNA-binding NtrC family response regulator
MRPLEPAPDPSLAAPAARPALLLVSGDWRDAATVRRYLEHAGYGVALASTPRTAFALLEQRTFVALVTEPELGSASGFELLAEARRRFPDVWRMLVAGRESVSESVGAMGSGTVHFCLPRPVEPAMLLSAVRHALGARCAD